MSEFENLSPVQKVMRLNPHAIAADGALKPFSQQYGEYALKLNTLKSSGEWEKLTTNGRAKAIAGYSPFVLAWDCQGFGVPGIGSRPLVLSLNSVRHIFDRHERDLDRLTGCLDKLSTELAANVLAFEDKTHVNHIDFILNEYSRSGNQMLTAVAIDANMDTIEVSSVRSVHGTAHLFSDMIKSAIRGREFYVNERTGAWLENQQHTDRSPSVVLSRHLLDAYYTHLNSGDGFYKADVIEDAALKRFAEAAETNEMGNLIGLDEPFDRLSGEPQEHMSDQGASDPPMMDAQGLAFEYSRLDGFKQADKREPSARTREER